MNFTGRAISIQSIMSLTKATLSITGRVVSAQSIMAIAKAALAVTGHAVSLLGPIIISITVAAMAFTGNALSALGGLHHRAVKYLTNMTRYTHRPTSGGM